MSSRYIDGDRRDAAIADYKTSGEPFKVVAARHGISSSALHSWVNPEPRRKRDRGLWGADEIELAGGRWILDPRTRVQRWVAA